VHRPGSRRRPVALLAAFVLALAGMLGLIGTIGSASAASPKCPCHNNKNESQSQ